jgi:hypothetical protein
MPTDIPAIRLKQIGDMLIRGDVGKEAGMAYLKIIV